MPPRRQPSLDDYIDIAASLLGADRAAIAALPRITRLQLGRPDVDTDAGMVVRVAAGSATHDEVVAWIRQRTGDGPH